MDNFLIITLLILLWAGYVKQFITIYRGKNANGISYQAYLIGAVAGVSVYLQATNEYTQIGYLVSGIMAVILTITVLYYQRITNYQSTENYNSFTISGIAGLVGIYGIAQAIKLYKYNLKKKIMMDNISYLGWASASVVNALYFAEDGIVILVSLIGAAVMYLSVIYVYKYNNDLALSEVDVV